MDRRFTLFMIGAVLVISVSALSSDTSRLTVTPSSPQFWEIGSDYPVSTFTCDFPMSEEKSGLKLDMLFNDVSGTDNSFVRKTRKSSQVVQKEFDGEVSVADNGNYTCQLADVQGNGTFNKSIELFAYERLDTSTIDRSITRKTGEKVKLDCRARNAPDAVVNSWSTPQHKNITESAGIYQLNEDKSVLTVDHVSANTSGTYWCEIRRVIIPTNPFFASALVNYTLVVHDEPSTTSTATGASPTNASPTNEIHVPAVTEGRAGSTSTAGNSGSAVFGAVGLVLLSGSITL